MRLQGITALSPHTFALRANAAKLMLLYPLTQYRGVFLAYFIDYAQENLRYYRLDDNDKELQTLLARLADQLGFSRLKEAATTASPHQWGESLADDLNAISDGSVPTVLYLDEFDRLQVDVLLRMFITALISRLKDGVSVAINARMLEIQPWSGLVASGEAVVIGRERESDMGMFTTDATPRPHIEVQAFGRGTVIANGQPVSNWDGALPRQLFFFFMDRPLVTRDEIFTTFWADLSRKEATNVFHVTKRKISERISQKIGEGNWELTQYQTGFYLPSSKIVRHYDVVEFIDAVERAEGTDDLREVQALYTRAVDLYRAPFLETIEMQWVVDRRGQLKQLYAQALIGLGRLAKADQQIELALSYFIRALRAMPEREDVHRDVMLLFHQMGRYDEARAQYHRLERMVHETLNIRPSRETRELYESLLGGT
jgi:DNA-binding SARP family transcriptional activator